MFYSTIVYIFHQNRPYSAAFLSFVNLCILYFYLFLCGFFWLFVFCPFLSCSPYRFWILGILPLLPKLHVLYCTVQYTVPYPPPPSPPSTWRVLSLRSLGLTLVPSLSSSSSFYNNTTNIYSTVYGLVNKKMLWKDIGRARIKPSRKGIWWGFDLQSYQFTMSVRGTVVQY